MIGRESLYLYKGEYGNTFGYGINQVYEIKQFDTKEEAESIISQLGDGMYEELNSGFQPFHHFPIYPIHILPEILIQLIRKNKIITVIGYGRLRTNA